LQALPQAPKVAHTVETMLAAIRSSIPPVPLQPLHFALSMEPFVGQLKQAADLELGQIPNYDKLHDVVTLCVAKRNESTVPHYVDATKAKFEKVIAALKGSRNLALVDHLLNLQSTIATRNKGKVQNQKPNQKPKTKNQKPNHFIPLPLPLLLSVGHHLPTGRDPKALDTFLLIALFHAPQNYFLSFSFLCF